jgi:hypothetical protein
MVSPFGVSTVSVADNGSVSRTIEPCGVENTQADGRRPNGVDRSGLPCQSVAAKDKSAAAKDNTNTKTNTIRRGRNPGLRAVFI